MGRMILWAGFRSSVPRLRLGRRLPWETKWRSAQRQKRVLVESARSKPAAFDSPRGERFRGGSVRHPETASTTPSSAQHPAALPVAKVPAPANLPGPARKAVCNSDLRYTPHKTGRPQAHSELRPRDSAKVPAPTSGLRPPSRGRFRWGCRRLRRLARRRSRGNGKGILHFLHMNFLAIFDGVGRVENNPVV